MTVDEFIRQLDNDSPCVEVCTSGSTGTPKRMLVEKRRMEASARLTCRFLGLRPGDKALLCMPVDYIAGKMMVVRARLWGLDLTVVPPSGHPLADIDDDFDLVAMVPLQVYNTLHVSAERARLGRIRHLLIGGGALDADLEADLCTLPGNIWVTYGMTETLSHIALRRVGDPWYTPFDTVNVSLADDCLVIDAPEVCPQTLVTNDLALLAPDGCRFRILGRRDNVICSGGLKLQIEDIEARLRPHLPLPFMITKVPDPKFGEAVALLIELRITNYELRQASQPLSGPTAIPDPTVITPATAPGASAPGCPPIPDPTVITPATAPGASAPGHPRIPDPTVITLATAPGASASGCKSPSSLVTHYSLLVTRFLPKYMRPRLCIPVDTLPLTPTGKPARAAAAALAAAYLANHPGATL